MSKDTIKVHSKVAELVKRSVTMKNFSECGYLVCSTDTRNNIHIIDVITPLFHNNIKKFPFLLDQTFCASTIDSMLPQGIFIGGIFMKHESINTFGLDNADIIEKFSDVFSEILTCLNHFYYLFYWNHKIQLFICKTLDSSISEIAFNIIDSEDLSLTLGKCFSRFDIRFPLTFMDTHDFSVNNDSKRNQEMPAPMKYFQEIDKFFNNQKLYIICHSASKQEIIHRNGDSQTSNIKITPNCRFGVSLSSIYKPDCVRTAPPLLFRVVRTTGKSINVTLHLKSLILFDSNFVNHPYIFDQCMKAMKRQLNIILFMIRESQSHELPYSTFVFKFPSLDFGISFFMRNNGFDPIVQSLKHLFGIKQLANIISDANLFEPQSLLSEYIICPHKNVKFTYKGSVILCEGYYAYFHYGCQNTNDSGWGCAYRSFQTIYSWFILNGLTENRSIPTIKEIQTCLYDLGDQPEAIIGSTKWIGSIEIGMVLEKLLGIQYKILTVLTNQKLSDYARQLLIHFEQNKCPIMIGGNNLSHTIVGVSFDSATGATYYMVIDPHYNGDEDIKKVVSKGFVGWKSDSFWKSNQSYNIILPILPQ